MGCFWRQAFYIRKESDAKRKKRKSKRLAVSNLRPHSAYKSDSCEFKVNVSSQDDLTLH